MVENFGRYQLLRKLATGGMGQVFLARQKGPSGFQKLLVVKRILPHLSDEQEFIEMFFDEARIAAALNHPNIAQIYDLGEVDGVYYLSMEYIQGSSLREVNTRAAKMLPDGVPLGLKLRIIADAAAALDYAHSATTHSGRALGIVHRDVSPQNILVGINGAVKLIDFGVAKAAGKVSTTVTGAIKGKYAYMSPEQARGEVLDRRSDVFGLGIVLYETLTGTRLLKRDNEPATLKAVVSAKVVPPSQVSRNVPRALDSLVLKALLRPRQDRYARAADLQGDIEDFLVKHRLAATSLHLSRMMNELYRSEIEEDHASSEPTQIDYPKSRSASANEKTNSATPRPAAAAAGVRGARSPSVSKKKPSSRAR